MPCAYSSDRKSSKCVSNAAPVSKNVSGSNPVWRALATRSRANQPADEEKEMTEAEKRQYEYHREHQCSNQPDPSKPQTKTMTEREIGRAMFGLQAARSIVSKAYNNLGRRDPYHLRKAQKTFGQPVSFEVLDSHVLRIKSKLESLVMNQNVVAATCDEKRCNDGDHNFVAVTEDNLSSILLCPFFFLQGGRTVATTYIHEAGHMANIDVNWAPGNEKYCRPDDTIECDNICPLTGENLLENVDAWMRLTYCIAMSS
ncbi:MAG TPA: hypothetical protein VF290_25090 [Pyrinomonadaceae bacterium]